MKLFHATNRNYQAGEALVSLLSQVERGWISEEAALEILSRWDADETYLHEDGAMVSFTANLDEAREILSTWNEGEGLILEIDGDALAADGLLRKNAEGYPAVWGECGPEYILGAV